MSIFGLNHGKITNLAESSSFEFDYSRFEPSYSEPEEIIESDVFTGAKDIITLGDHASFKIIMFLFKQGDPATKFNTLYGWNHEDVYFYPHHDGLASGDGLGKALQDGSSVKVPCHITLIKPFYYEDASGTDYSRDAALIEIITKEYIDLAKILQLAV